MTLHFGLEKEFFVYRRIVVFPEGEGREYTLASKYGLPHDDCGYLVESRSRPMNSIVEAVFNLRAQIWEIEKAASIKGLVLDDTPVMKLPPSLLLEARRLHAKGVISYRNYRGHTQHRNSRSEQTAGLHISITDQKFYNYGDKRYEYNTNFDWMAIFWRLDVAFKDEIRAAKRNPGFYEVKSDGRVEYRSLPANVDLDRVINVLHDIRKELRI